MYQYYSDNPQVKSFMDRNIMHLLSQPGDNTHISLCSITIPNSNNNQDGIQLKETYNPSIFPTKAGVYLIQENRPPPGGGGNQYIGSATNFQTRIGNHYASIRHVGENMNSAKLHNIISIKGPSNFTWFLVTEQPDYYKDITREYPELRSDNNLFYVMQSFTQYAVRSLEQAIITEIKPTINSVEQVTFTTT